MEAGVFFEARVGVTSGEGGNEMRNERKSVRPNDKWVLVRPVVLCGRFLKAQTNSWWRIIRRRRRAGQKARVYLRQSLLVYRAAAAALIRLRRGSSSSAPRCQVKLNRYFFGRGNKKREETYFSLLREIHHI